jgi:quinol monooxygenase YgiN
MEQQFLSAAKNVIEESRKEVGCLVYSLHESEQDPQQFVFYELFKSDTDLQAHRKSKHVVDFLKTINPILVPNGFVLSEYVLK